MCGQMPCILRNICCELILFFVFERRCPEVRRVAARRLPDRFQQENLDQSVSATRRVAAPLILLTRDINAERLTEGMRVLRVTSVPTPTSALRSSYSLGILGIQRC